MKVAVLKGGRSLERGVSLRSGARVEDALERLGHEVVPLDAGGDLVKRLAAERARRRLRRHARPRRRGRHRAGAAGDPRHPLHRPRRRRLRALHGQGPGQARAARGRGADARLVRLQRDRLPRARRRRCARASSRSGSASRSWSSRAAAARRSASSSPQQLVEVPEALVSAFSYDDRVLLERFVDGRELAVSVLGDEALPIVEAIPQPGDRYDFEARYEIGRTSLRLPRGAERRRRPRRLPRRRSAPTRRSAARASPGST